MFDYLPSIGFSNTDIPELKAVLIKASKNPAEIIECENGRYVRWVSGSGAELWIQFDKNQEMIGATPFYQALTPVPLGITKEIVRRDASRLDGAIFGFRNPSAIYCPAERQIIVFDLPDRGRYRPMKYPFISPVSLCGIPLKLDFFVTDQNYLQVNSASRIASEAFIASLVFQADKSRPESTARINGHLLEFEKLTNPLTGLLFYRLKIRTYLMELDVISEPDLITQPLVPGGVISGQFWLCGRILEPKYKNILDKKLKQA